MNEHELSVNVTAQGNPTAEQLLHFSVISRHGCHTEEQLSSVNFGLLMIRQHMPHNAL